MRRKVSEKITINVKWKQGKSTKRRFEEKIRDKNIF
jgi:hypothetical protein